MRWVTYFGLVLRRVWARRGMLLGSFLGATLVIALLAVLPLYEASVSAIDLLFTFRQAPDSTVDLSAALTMNEYSADAGRRRPASHGRSLGGGGGLVPRGGGAHRQPGTGADPAGLPRLAGAGRGLAGAGASPDQTPWPQPSIEATQSRLFTSPDIAGPAGDGRGGVPRLRGPGPQAATRSWKWSSARSSPPWPSWRWATGWCLRAFASQPDWFEMVEVAGIARPADPEADHLGRGGPGPAGLRGAGDLRRLAGRLRRRPGERPLAAGGAGLPAPHRHPHLHPAPRPRSGDAGEGRTNCSRGSSSSPGRVARSEGIRTISQLPDLIEEFGVRSVVFGAPILAMLALVVAGALYFLIYMAAWPWSGSRRNWPCCACGEPPPGRPSASTPPSRR